MRHEEAETWSGTTARAEGAECTVSLSSMGLGLESGTRAGTEAGDKAG